MADEIDLSNDRILHDTDREVARIAEGLCYHPNKSGLKITHFTRDFDRLLTMVKQIIL